MKSPSFIHALNLNILRNKIMSISQKKKKEPDLVLIGPLLKDVEYYSDSELYESCMQISSQRLQIKIMMGRCI